MVLLIVTPAIEKAISASRQVQSHSNDSVTIPDVAAGDPVSHEDLVQISGILQQEKADDAGFAGAGYLDAMLKGTSIYKAPPQPKPPKSGEYLKLMARLREEEDRRTYARMTGPPTAPQPFADLTSTHDASATTLEDEEMTYADVNRQVTLIINVLVTIIACSAGIWVTAWHWPTPARLGLSMIGSGVVAVAEVAIYFGYIKRLSDARKTERKVVETKEVLDTWVTKKSSTNHVREDLLRHRKGKHR